MRTIVFDTPRIGQWVCERTGGAFNGEGAAIGLEQGGELIAGVLYDQYNGRSACMHVAAAKGASWMTRPYLRICFDYPFNQLKLNTLIGLVDSTNEDALRFDKHLGFRLATVIPGAGQKGDLCILTMARNQCRFLKD